MIEFAAAVVVEGKSAVASVREVVAFCDGDSSVALSNGRTFDYLSRLYVRTGDILYSTRSRPMFRIIADSAVRHDFLYGPCTTEMYEIQYGLRNHSNCSDLRQTYG